MLNIYPIPAFADNYIWLLALDNKVWVVDPGESSPLISHIEQHGLELQAILLTHQHLDHWSGVPDILKRWPVPVCGPAAMPAAIQPLITQTLHEGDQIWVADQPFQVMATPGHTAEHIVYFCDTSPAPLLFVGDTLFAAGCGRAFYSATDLFNSIQRLQRLPDNTIIYPSHEYTLSNLAFAMTVEPDNQALSERLRHCQQTRAAGLPTLPTTLGLERLTNPFLRLTNTSLQKNVRTASKSSQNCDLGIFCALRNWKNEH